MGVFRHRINSSDTTARDSGLNLIGGSTITLTAVGTDGVQIDVNPSALPASGLIQRSWSFPGTLAAATGALVYRLSVGETYAGATAEVSTAPTHASTFLTVDINYSAATCPPTTSIFTTQTRRLIFPNGSFVGAMTAPPDVTSYAANGFFSCDIDQVGGTVAGGNLVVTLYTTVT